MFKYALFDYVPQRYLRRASFDTLENDRFILDFKSGRRYATDKASRLIGKALSLMDLKDTVIVCIPASSCSGKRPQVERPTDLYPQVPQFLCQAVRPMWCNRRVRAYPCHRKEREGTHLRRIRSRGQRVDRRGFLQGQAHPAHSCVLSVASVTLRDAERTTSAHRAGHQTHSRSGWNRQGHTSEWLGALHDVINIAAPPFLAKTKNYRRTNNYKYN